MCPLSFDADPSTASPTTAPPSRSARAGAIPEPSRRLDARRQVRGPSHQLWGHAERRAWRDGDAKHRAGSGIVQRRNRLVGAREDIIGTLDDLVGGEPAARPAKVHRATAGGEGPTQV